MYVLSNARSLRFGNEAYDIRIKVNLYQNILLYEGEKM